MKTALLSWEPAQQLVRRVASRLEALGPACEDLRSVTEDARVACYFAPERPFVIDVRLADCRGLHGMAFRCGADADHPFIVTLRDYMSGRRQHYADSALEAYYTACQPDSAAAAVGLDAREAHPALVAGAPLAGALPWDFRTPEEHEVFWTAVAAQDYRAHGYQLSASDGWKSWGPMTRLAAEAEYARLVRTFESIRRSGYRRSPGPDGDIEGQVLLHGQEFRVLLGPGQHRAAALAALGRRTATVRLYPSFVRREEVELWPNVARGYFGTEQAVKIFDRVFAGRQPCRRRETTAAPVPPLDAQGSAGLA